MEKQAIFSIVLRLISHLLLFIFFVQFYLIEQMGDYMKDRATTSSRLEQASVSEFPTITICMDPPLKPSVMSKYGFKTIGEVVKLLDLITTGRLGKKSFNREAGNVLEKTTQRLWDVPRHSCLESNKYKQSTNRARRPGVFFKILSSLALSLVLNSFCVVLDFHGL